jgi:hypothetical protein
MGIVPAAAWHVRARPSPSTGEKLTGGGHCRIPLAQSPGSPYLADNSDVDAS